MTISELYIWDEAETEMYERHAIWGANLHEFTLDGFRNRQTVPNKALAILSFQNCEDILVRGCQPSFSEAPFLRLEGDQTDRVSVIDNDLSAVDTAFEFANEVSKTKVYRSDNYLP